MMKKIIAASLSFAPFLALAQAADPLALTNSTLVITRIVNFLNKLTPFIVALAVLFVLFGILQFVMAAGDEEGRKAAQSKIIWGVVGIVIMVSLYGIISFLSSQLNLTGGAAPIAPKL